jgi:hypothetical protein
MYNNNMVHALLNMTPNEATKPSHAMSLNYNIQLQATFTIKYPASEIGSSVKLYRKKTLGHKERVSSFSQNSYTINDSTEKHGQMYYKVEGNGRPTLRAELFKV